MEVDITDKGRNYLDRMNQGNLPESATDGQSIFDYTILHTITSVGPQDIEDTISKVSQDHGPVTGESIKTSFRRLFEAGYLEEVR